LQIPTTCGIPTLKSVQFVTKKSAIAFDSCNNKFYTYNPKTQIWSEVSGGGGGGIDSLKRSTDSVFARKNGSFIFQYKDSVGAGSDTAKVVIAQVRNIEATTLNIGEVVYIYGSTGNTASVKRASNKDDSTSSRTLGVVRSSIASGAIGFVTTQGQCEKMHLGSYSEGDILWLDSIAGGFTKVKPIAPRHSVFIGIVERANNGNGLAYIKPQNGYEIGELHDVAITSVQNNNVLIYSDTTKVWKNRPYGLQSLLNAGYIAQNSAIALNNGSNYSSWLNNGSGIQFSMQNSSQYTNIANPQYEIFYNNTFGNTKAQSMLLGYNNSISQYALSWYKLNASNVGLEKLLLPRYQTNQTQSHTYYLPDVNTGASSINLVSSVNGNVADNYGNVTISAGGSIGANGLSGTDSIKLGGTLLQNTTINGAGYQMSIGTTGSPITALRLNGEQVSFESLNPRHTNNPERCVIAVIDTASNNTLKTIPIGSVGEGKVLRGKFTCIYDINLADYVVTWKVIKNTTGFTWSLYRFAGGRFNLQNDIVDPNAGNAFSDCDWFGGVMFEPNHFGSERYGQIFELNKHTAQIKLFDASGTGVDEVQSASFEIRLYESCGEGDTSIPN